MIASERTLFDTSSTTLLFHSADNYCMAMAEQPEEPVGVPTGEEGGEGPPPPTDPSSPPLPLKPPSPDLPPPVLPHEGENMGDKDEELLLTGATPESVPPPEEVVQVENGKFPNCACVCTCTCVTIDMILALTHYT